MKLTTIGGVEVDVCALHGLWLDKGELQKVLKSTRTGTIAAAQARERQARQDGKVAGAMWGWASLFVK